MLFASFDFLIFFAVAFGAYWALNGRPRLQATWLLAASYFFYMAASKPVDGPLPTPWYYVGLLIASTLVDYVCGLRIARSRSLAQSGQDAPEAFRTGSGWLALSVLTNLGLLGYFKYTGFLAEATSDIAALFGRDLALPAIALLLPVGISFYTFQSLSYTIDVYRGRLEAERSLLRFAVFVSFFPQLVAGPIVRASSFLPQLHRRHTLARADVDIALWRISKGLVKKLLFADFIAASFTDRVFATPIEHSSLENLIALYAFTLQLYGDFSGYSDIAIGTGRLLGFHLPENFDRPYQATGTADFWRRWHMTLSTWLRDYLYYPLGGSRFGLRRTCVNLWITMFLIGIWHGASWTFVVYANLQACAMVYNRLCRHYRAQAGARRMLGVGGVSLAVAGLFAIVAGVSGQQAFIAPLAAAAGVIAFANGLLPDTDKQPLLRPVHVFLTLHFCVLSRLYFRADSFEAADAMFSKLVAWDGLGVRPGLLGQEDLEKWLLAHPVLSGLAPIGRWCVLWVLVGGFVLHYVPRSWTDAVPERIVARTPAIVFGVAFALLLGGLSLLLAGPRPNIYFVF